MVKLGIFSTRNSTCCCRFSHLALNSLGGREVLWLERKMGRQGTEVLILVLPWTCCLALTRLLTARFLPCLCIGCDGSKQIQGQSRRGEHIALGVLPGVDNAKRHLAFWNACRTVHIWLFTSSSQNSNSDGCALGLCPIPKLTSQ